MLRDQIKSAIVDWFESQRAGLTGTTDHEIYESLTDRIMERIQPIVDAASPVSSDPNTSATVICASCRKPLAIGDQWFAAQGQWYCRTCFEQRGGVVHPAMTFSDDPHRGL